MTILQRALRLTALAGLPLAALCQTPRTAPIPADPLELVNGPIQILDTPESRQPAMQLLARARANESLKAAGRGYDLKASFTVTSGGQTEYDGDWQIEEIYVPHLGTRWTAKAKAGYSTTQITAANHSYGDGPGNTIPLRLHEARSSITGAVATNTAADLIRTSTAMYHGVPVTCYLFGVSSISLTVTPGRRWDETEECIDPRSGLIQVHSQVPGRYSGYDYTDAPKLGDHVVPRKIIVTEGGKVVSQIRVDSLTELSEADPNLFVPSAEMKARGDAIATTGAVKYPVFPEHRTIPADAASRCVCSAWLRHRDKWWRRIPCSRPTRTVRRQWISPNR